MKGIQETIYIIFLFFCTTFLPSSIAQEWNCTSSERTGVCLFSSKERRTWHEASVHCSQRNGGLAHSNHTQLIIKTIAWPPEESIWIGLAWINGRLQWMTHTPQEETNIEVVNNYANQRRDTTKSCYSMNRNAEYVIEQCQQQQFYYVCVKPASRNEDVMFNHTSLGPVQNFQIKLTVNGSVVPNSPFYMVYPDVRDFAMYCIATNDTLSYCLYSRIRWLKNGAYQPHVDNSLFISDIDYDSRSRDDIILWKLNWLGKITCEIFCFSTGKAYQSEEAIIVFADTVALRVEFQFRSSPMNLSSMQQHFHQEIQPELKEKISLNKTDGVSIFQTDRIPFLSRPDVSLNTFSFYTHLTKHSDRVLPLAIYLRKVLVEPGHWLTGPLASNRTGMFQDIKVVLLNFCLGSGINPELVLAIQPTFSRGLNSRFRYQRISNLCQYASKQCKADWFNPPKFEALPQPLSCLRCLAKFTEHRERCLTVIRPQSFSKSVTQCLAKYDFDEKDDLWDLSEWIELSLDWINKNEEAAVALNSNQMWLPVRRRTHLGPLRPAWPWSFPYESNTLVQSSSDEQMKSIVNQTELRADWSHINASESCLTMDISTKTLKSASCQARLPMICVRPKLNGYLSYNDSSSFRTSAQCPFDWVTSVLIAERNNCYKFFYSEVSLTFDEAENECQQYDGHLAIIADPSTLAVFIHVFNLEELASEFWIGLRRFGGQYKWVDQSTLDYEHLIEWSDNVNEQIYGVSMAVSGSEVPKLHWKRNTKESRLTRFVCQTNIFPQQETILHLTVSNQSYSPEISVQSLSLHSRKVRRSSAIPSDFQLRLDLDGDFPEEEVSSSDKNKFYIKLTCFLANSTLAVYSSSKNTTLNYKLIEPKASDPSQLMWRAAETSCEVWEIWSTESLQASWIMPGDGNTVDKLSSYIVRLRHRNQTYSSLSHDATFQASDSQRAAFGRILPITDELVKNPFPNLAKIVPAYDPISFESDSQSANALLVKYQIVFMRTPTPIGDDLVYKRINETLEYTELLDRVTALMDNKTSPFLDFDLVSIRSTDFCPGEITNMYGEFLNFSYGVIEKSMNGSTESELEWPQSSAGSWVEPTPLCVTQNGVLLRRRCLGDRFSGLYWESIENKISDPLCVKNSPLLQILLETMKITNTSQILQTIRSSIEGWNPNAAELEMLAKSLFKSVQYSQILNGNDLDNLQKIIQQIADLKTEKLILAQQSSWMSSNLAGATEQLLAKMSTLNSTTEHLELKQPFMAARSFDRQNEDNNVIGFSVATNENSIIRSDFLLSQATYETIKESDVVVLLPSYQLQPTPGKQRVTFVAYPDTRLIDGSAATGKFSSAVFNSDPSQPSGLVQSDKLYTGAGGMVQVHLNPRPSHMDPVEVFFRPTRNVTGNRHLLRCAYWEERANFGRGGWSTDGCWLESTDRNGMEVCRCNHLSTFTLLVCQSEDYLQSTVHGAILNAITFIGSFTSIFGLSLILATFAIFPTWRKSRGHKLLVQLSLALIVLLLTFIGGVNNISNTHACRTAGVFLHYFLLAAFCWMTVEAYHQYLRMVKVFDTYIPRFLMKASIFAWTAPLIPVIIILIYDVDLYTNSLSYCWLENTPFYVAVLLPIIFLILINVYLFVLVTRSILASGRGLRTNQSEEKQNREKLLACFLNVILLGLSWIFGFVAIGPTNSVIFSYLFCITTTFQGFFLFILYVVRDPSARTLWLKLFGVTDRKPGTVGRGKKTQVQVSADQPLPHSEFNTSSTAGTFNSNPETNTHELTGRVKQK